ncbi:putative repeat protein (TIGR01451 family)/predicted secreted protein (Por secretion system target) [Flavobacterium sp. 270]|uniref:DUF7619 domain-containing protein n=1 Tax=Flavobacterium sp. 270 TaxID=2512114 RepID=UPI001066248A|nr:T9SS type A sorting domain-containing protein [Flavobacterium sp. 270]TDW51516.1 putative repeat protein (TIGR01451 family)/predicted secreted protein (Por secretion system target) [Flavobacterium sp. 270]
MKKNYFLLFILLFSFVINAQTIVFKDQNFKTILLVASINNSIAKDLQGNFTSVDKNGDYEIQVEEAKNISWLDLRNSLISDIEGIENFSQLIHLDLGNEGSVNYNTLKVLKISMLTKLQYLNCQANYDLNNLDFAGCTNLTALNCSSTKPGALDLRSFTKLETIECDNTYLTSLNVSGLINLKTLLSSGNQFTILDLTSCKNLTEVTMHTGQLVTLDISGLTQLQKINVYNNKLTSFKLSGCTSLTHVDAWINKLPTLDVSNLKNLTYLNLLSNELETLNLKNSNNLEDINCDNNKIEALDVKDLVNLKNLSCSRNNLTSIDVTNLKKLEWLIVSFNKLENLDISTCPLLANLHINNNNLIFINQKNGIKKHNYQYHDNDNLKYICCDELDDYLFPSYGVSYSFSINTYCSFTPGGIYYVIKGSNAFDSNNNGPDQVDIKLPNLNYKITDGIKSANIIANSSGNYELQAGEGTHTITPIIENPTYFKVSPESIDIKFPDSPSPFVQNFYVTPNGSHQDLEISVLPKIPARPGFDAIYKLVYKNKGNQIKSGTVVLDFNDAVLDYISSVPSLSNQATNKLTWNYVDLQPFETREITVVLNVNSPMETPAVNIDDRLSFNALITPVTNDEKPVDNSFALRQIVVGSFDPNDKTCLEGDVIKSELIGEYVHYMIRFENTGTYPAENIVVKDMIDLSKFDISTLVPTSASHSYTTKISDGNKVEFIFEKINLPFNDADNDGYIAFKIKTLPTLVVGDSFTNEANIYFDYNFPILTNKASSTFKVLGTQDFEFSNYVNIYPVPTKDILNINIKNDIQIKSMAVYDLLGQLIIAVPNAEKVSNIDVSNLRTGSYFLKITSDKGISNAKFIKK